MSDGLLLMLNEDGVAEVYDDTWDIVIHCENEKEFNEAKEKILSMNWIPVTERNPLDSGHYLCSFHKSNDVRWSFWTGGSWYGYAANEISAWMPLPAPYKEGEEDESSR